MRVHEHASVTKYPVHHRCTPGHVHTDLLRAGLIKDPYYRFEDDNLDWVRNETW